jgi:hypothetical protein
MLSVYYRCRSLGTACESVNEETDEEGGFCRVRVVEEGEEGWNKVVRHQSLNKLILIGENDYKEGTYNYRHELNVWTWKKDNTN